MKQILTFIFALVMGGVIGLGGMTLILSFMHDEPISATAATVLGKIDWDIVLILPIVVCAGVLNIALHELGHLVMGLATGYGFVSYRLFSLTVVRQQGRLRLKRFSIQGTGGQCLLSPPDMPAEQMPVMLYHLGGVIFNVAVAAVSLAVILQADDLGPISAVWWGMCLLLGVGLALLNGIPMRVGGMGNDGYNALEMHRHPEQRQQMASMLRANARIMSGDRPAELPAEWFALPENLDASNPISCNQTVMHAAWLADAMRLEEARDLLATLSEKAELPQLFKLEVASELLFLRLTTGQQDQVADLLADDKLQAYIKQYARVMSSKQRVLWAIARYHRHDEAEAQRIYQQLIAQRDSYLMQGEIASDLHIMEKLMDI